MDTMASHAWGAFHMRTKASQPAIPYCRIPHTARAEAARAGRTRLARSPCRAKALAPTKTPIHCAADSLEQLAHYSGIHDCCMHYCSCVSIHAILIMMLVLSWGGIAVEQATHWAVRERLPTRFEILSP